MNTWESGATIVADRQSEWLPNSVPNQAEKPPLSIAFDRARESIRARGAMRIPNEIGPLDAAEKELIELFFEFQKSLTIQELIDESAKNTQSRVRIALAEGSLETLFVSAFPYILTEVGMPSSILFDAVVVGVVARAFWVLFCASGRDRLQKSMVDSYESSFRGFARRALAFRKRLLLGYGIDVTDFLVEGSLLSPACRDALDGIGRADARDGPPNPLGE